MSKDGLGVADTAGTVRASRTEKVRRYLRNAIGSGDYGAGSRLPSENAIATRLSVSRAVVREAVSGLAAEGIVRAEQGRGTFVSERPAVRQLEMSPIVNIGDLIAWMDLRIAIEQESARLAAERRSEADVDHIGTIHQRLIDLGRAGERAVDLDFAFHLAIAQATENSVLVEAQRSLGEHIRNWMSAMVITTRDSPAERHQRRNREHEAILDAIRRIDPQAAAEAARRHLENGRTRLLAELSEARQ